MAQDTSNSSISRLAPFIEKIEKLTRPQRIGIYVGGMVLLIGMSVWLLLWPKYEDIGQLENRLEKVQAELAEAKKNASELNDWRSRMQEKEVQYRQVMRALPEKEEIPSLLTGISEAGKDAGLEFVLFQPKPESTKDFYAEIPVDINVNGTYHQVAVFFDKVANLPRIVNIRNIKMSPQSRKDSNSDLMTTCQAVTYKFIEPPDKTEKKGKSPKKRR